MLSDLRYALRALRGNRAFTAAALLALALGIGANTAMFSVVYTVLLKPLPYRQPDRLVWIAIYNKRFKAEIVTGPDFLDWRAQARSFDPMAAVGAADRTVTGIPDPFDIRTTGISERLGRIFGVQPSLGRDFLPGELTPGAAANPAVLSDHFFRSYFHGDRSALGARLELNGRPFTVVGVLQPGFRLALPSPFGPQTEAEAIVPFVIDPATQRRDARGMVIVQVLARLRPGVSLAAARDEIAAIQSHLPRPPFLRPGDQQLQFEPLRDRLLGNTGRALLILLSAVGFVLLIACANVANLLLVRASGRRGEIAVRMALGASRARLLRQALTESVTLALAGGAAGLLLAAWSIRLIVNWNVVVVPRLKDAGLSLPVLLFAFAVATLTGVVFGIAPALASARTDLNDALKQGAGSAGPSPARRRVRGLLVAAEVALSLVLLAGAGLMVKSLWVMHASTSAEMPDRVLTASLQISNPRYRDAAQSSVFMDDFLERIESLPGVRAAAALDSGTSGLLRLADAAIEPVRTDYLKVSPHFFGAAGIRLLKGRLFEQGDRAGAPRVAVVNETLARRFAPGYPRETPLGRRVLVPTPGSDTPSPAAVVGVVADFRASRLDAPVEPQLFLPAAQSGAGNQLLVRASSDPAALTGAIRAQGRPLSIALLHPETLADRLDASIAPRRFEMTLLIVFAALAVLLALIGIYGVVAYMVTQRTREIGIRVALGAQRPDVVRLVLGEGLRLVCAGVVVGLGAALALTRFLQSFLYGVKPADVLTFVAVSLLLVAVAALAAWLPARRAAAVDPLVALRYE